MDHVIIVLRGLYNDFTDRRGFDQEWDQIDDEIKTEILSSWYRIIAAEFARGDDEPPDDILKLVRGW